MHELKKLRKIFSKYARTENTAFFASAHHLSRNLRDMGSSLKINLFVRIDSIYLFSFYLQDYDKQ